MTRSTPRATPPTCSRDWAIDYLAERKDRPEPFFLYLAYNAPHVPIQPPPEWLQRVKDASPESPWQRAKLVALIEHLDDGIGKVMQALADNGQRENTLVIFTSDNGGDTDNTAATNGPLMAARRRCGKAACGYRPSLRGRGTPGGNDHAAVFATMDIFATALEAAGVTYSGEVDARSFLPVLLGKATAAPPRDLFFVRREYPGGVNYGARNGDYKLGAKHAGRSLHALQPPRRSRRRPRTSRPRSRRSSSN